MCCIASLYCTILLFFAAVIHKYVVVGVGWGKDTGVDSVVMGLVELIPVQTLLACQFCSRLARWLE